MTNVEMDKWARTHAAGFGALLSEVLGSGCLRDRTDLRDRVKEAVTDHETFVRSVLATVA